MLEFTEEERRYIEEHLENASELLRTDNLRQVLSALLKWAIISGAVDDPKMAKEHELIHKMFSDIRRRNQLKIPDSEAYPKPIKPRAKDIEFIREHIKDEEVFKYLESDKTLSLLRSLNLWIQKKGKDKDGRLTETGLKAARIYEDFREECIKTKHILNEDSSWNRRVHPSLKEEIQEAEDAAPRRKSLWF